MRPAFGLETTTHRVLSNVLRGSPASACHDSATARWWHEHGPASFESAGGEAARLAYGLSIFFGNSAVGSLLRARAPDLPIGSFAPVAAELRFFLGSVRLDVFEGRRTFHAVSRHPALPDEGKKSGFRL